VAARAGTIIAARHDVPEGQCPYAGQPTAPACWSEVDHVLVDHGDGTSALYLHLAPADPPVSVGQVVETGTPLRTAGSSGRSSGVHLHFQVQDTPSAATLAQPGGFLGTAFPFAFADPDVLAKAPDGHLVEGTTYVSGNPGTGTGPSGVAPASSCSASCPATTGAQSSDQARRLLRGTNVDSARAQVASQVAGKAAWPCSSDGRPASCFPQLATS
jgi:hypothetical protein